jgi:hypothetical protein
MFVALVRGSVISRRQIVSVDISKEIANRVAEIAALNREMLDGVFYIFLAIVAAFIAASITGKVELHKLVMVLAVSIPFWIDRPDFFIHRNAAYIKEAQAATAAQGEQTQQSARVVPYEEWKKARWKSNAFVLPIDLIAAIAIVWMIWTSGAFLVGVNEAAFVRNCAITLVIGILLIPVSIKLAYVKW